MSLKPRPSFWFSNLPALLLAIILLGSFQAGVFAQTAAPAKKPSTAVPKKAKASEAPPPEVKIPDVTTQGQVFVVTKGGINIKLALVSVAAYREKELLAQFDKTWEAEQDERAQAAARVDEAKKATEAANDRLKEARAREDSARAYLLANLGNKNALAAMYATSAESLRLSTAYRAALDVGSEERKKLAALSSARHFIEKLNDPLAVSKSDADGNFDVTLPSGSYVLVATGKRLAGNSTELYEWLVRIEAIKPLKVMLSNDNMVGNKCDECVPLPVRSGPV